MKPTVGSLFAGIGGFDLGFERAGFEVKWQVEIDPWCRKVLAKNFPRAERYEDVRECGAHNLNSVDVVMGGFPCQDISIAGRKAGISGERSGLWTEMARIIRELRPRSLLIENVSALITSGLDRVLCDLAAIGFDAEWQIVSASSVGLPHLRQRVWILAYPMREGSQRRDAWQSVSESAEATFTEHCHKGSEQWSGLDDFTASLPDVHGLSVGLVRRCITGLGNAVVPQIPEMYARRIKAVLEGAA